MAMSGSRGTMLRKMVFGRAVAFPPISIHMPRGYHADDLMLMMLDALNRPYHGISFRFDREKDWYLTDDGCAANLSARTRRTREA